MLYRKTLENMFKAIRNETVMAAPFYNLVDIETVNGTVFRTFGKSRDFGKDLYEDWVAPMLKSDLQVEGWIHGPGNLPSNCSLPFKVFNIESVNVPELNYGFSTEKDHSKWAVSDSRNLWVCVGDINRQEHQKVRGGGTVCQLQGNVWNAYKKLVSSVEPCRQNDDHHNVV